MNLRPSALITVSVATLILLSGCSASASIGTDSGTDTDTTDETTEVATITSAELGQNISDFYEEQNGVASDIDCGEDDIAVEEGAVISCLGIDPTTGDEVPLNVTLSNVDGANYEFDVTQ